jgi:hypothetical protein
MQVQQRAPIASQCQVLGTMHQQMTRLVDHGAWPDATLV